jgi:hypothetical protein
MQRLHFLMQTRGRGSCCAVLLLLLLASSTLMSTSK